MSLFASTEEERKELQQKWKEEYGLHLSFTHPLKDVGASWEQNKDIYRHHRNPIFYNNGTWVDTYDENLYETIELVHNHQGAPIVNKTWKTGEPTRKEKKFKKGKIILSNSLPSFRK